MKRILKIIVMGIVLFSLASCASTDKEEVEATDNTSQGETDTRTDVTPQGYTGHPLDEPGSLLAKRIFYFDFNRSDITDEDREAIDAHARYLSANGSETIVLEGHADERGSREYNLALGERRAKAVQQLLVLQGAAKSQIQIISFGEERPVATGHDESAWQQNRRVEILYPGH